MPTRTEDMRANQAADRRRNEAYGRLNAAQRRDAEISDPKDKRQWNALIQWLLSESKHLDEGDRRRMFAHLWECAEQMNQGARRVRADVGR